MQARRATTIAFLVALVLTIDVLAQTNVGAIIGHVADQSGGAIQAATVTLLNPATNEKITIQTNDRGDYLFNSVRPATYTVSARPSISTRYTPSPTCRMWVPAAISVPNPAG